jgi:hypothetical protein
MSDELLNALQDDISNILNKPTTFEEKLRELKVFFEEVFGSTD